MTDDDLNWLAEHACRAARPAIVNERVKGWLFRQSGGRIRQINSVNPLPETRGDAALTIAEAEIFYSAHGQPPLFRVPAIAGEMEPVLDRLGYRPEGETLTLFNALATPTAECSEQAVLMDEPDGEWLDARARMSQVSAHDDEIYRRMITLIEGPKKFGAAKIEDRVVSIAYGVIHQGLFVLESVMTDAGFRQRGLARKTLGTLLAWAQGSGAEAASLQVEVANGPARALYATLGFNRELYRYHYRRQQMQ